MTESIEASPSKHLLKGSTTNETHVLQDTDGNYFLSLNDDRGELCRWWFTDEANENIVGALHNFGQALNMEPAQQWTYLQRVLEYDVEEGESEIEAAETLINTAFNSEEIFVLGQSFAAVGDELLIDCLDAVAAFLLAL